MLTRADKDNTIVILPTHQYETKLQDFIQNNDFHTKATDPTKTFQHRSEPQPNKAQP